MSRVDGFVRKAMLAACVGAILLIGLAGVGVTILLSWDDEDSKAVWRHALASKDGQLRLYEVFPGEWDHVYVFAPYTPRSSVCRTLGVTPVDCERVVAFESQDDGAMSLALVADARVVRYVEHGRGNGDFGPVATGRPVPRAQAVYRIVAGEALSTGSRSLAFVALEQPSSAAMPVPPR